MAPPIALSSFDFFLVVTSKPGGDKPHPYDCPSSITSVGKWFIPSLNKYASGLGCVAEE